MTMTLDAVPVDKVEPINIDAIKPEANYRCRLQVGARQRWRNYTGGRITTKKEQDGNTSVTHAPAVHITVPIKGETLCGLAVQQNEWIAANRTKATLTGSNSTVRRSSSQRPVQPGDGHAVYKGDVAKQLLVTAYEETTDPSEDRRVFLNPWDQMRQMIAEGFKDVMAVILSARDEFESTTKTPKAK